MRMWMVDPALLCDKHLMGEHFEIHKHRHNFVKHHRISGRVRPVVLIEPRAMQTRHDALAQEILHRGFNHNSPYILPDLSYLPDEDKNVRVSQTVSLRELSKRCPACRERITPLLPLTEPSVRTRTLQKSAENITNVVHTNMVYIKNLKIKRK